jgi:excisionase family DNA binding protein
MLYVVPYDVDYEKYLKSTKNTNKGTKKTKKRSAFDVPKDHFDGYYKLGHMAISHFHGTVGEGKVNGKVDKNFGGEAYVAVLTEGEKITKEEYDALSDQSPQEEKIKYKKLTNAQKSRFSAWKRKVHNLPEKPGEAFYSAQELADKLGYNVMTIYRYIKAGKLKAYKVGKEFRIDREEFDKFLEYVRKNKE